jgi:SnoaL-like polyketide cyclase
MTAEDTKALLRRWYDEMWGQLRADLIPELVGPVYMRHEMGGTRSVTPEEYRDQTAAFMTQISVHDFRYGLIAEEDKVCAVGSWRLKAAEGVNDVFGAEGKQWDWVQLFRAENGRLVETWLSGIGMDSGWQDVVWNHCPDLARPTIN